jgi:hypothetical protein
MACDLTLNGISYSVSKIPSAIKQMQIARRVLPILAGGEKVESIFNNIGSIKDEDFEYVLIGLLDGVKRKDGGKSGVWSSVVVNGAIAYQDIDMLDLLQLAKASAMENFGFLGNVESLMSGVTKQA